MAEVSSVSPSTAGAAFNVGFDDLLKIVLTQLTYQDPLKPLDNAEFVSQLAQFTQIQQTKTMSDAVQALLETSAVTQSSALLGRSVEASTRQGAVRGVVKSISITSGAASLTLELAGGQTLAGVALSDITTINGGN